MTLFLVPELKKSDENLKDRKILEFRSISIGALVVTCPGAIVKHSFVS